AQEQGIDTLHGFFNHATALEILESHGQADAITACGVFAHIADVTGVMEGVRALLSAKGVFATDSQYWLDMVERLHYDNIFHQHLRYYSMRPLIHLHRQYGLEVFDVERSDVYGGSVRVFAGHAGAHPVSERVDELLATENAAGLYQEETYERFARQVSDRRRALFDEVYSQKRSGKKVIGLGAPAKATVIANYCGLGPDLLDYITEVNPLRVGTYLPGVRVPIVDEEDMFHDPRPADAGILFAWNYYDEVVPKLRQRGWEGQVILPGGRLP
ncbi:MAG: class I SAM-dependent methyltransferase, partial [Acidimicrobiales bacterium]